MNATTTKTTGTGNDAVYMVEYFKRWDHTAPAYVGEIGYARFDRDFGMVFVRLNRGRSLMIPAVIAAEFIRAVRDAAGKPVGDPHGYGAKLFPAKATRTPSPAPSPAGAGELPGMPDFGSDDEFPKSFPYATANRLGRVRVACYTNTEIQEFSGTTYGHLDAAC